ncbi:MAG: flagellar hook-length control protein FliK [Maritalea sp.]
MSPAQIGIFCRSPRNIFRATTIRTQICWSRNKQHFDFATTIIPPKLGPLLASMWVDTCQKFDEWVLNVQIGLSAAASFPGFELAGEITTDAGTVNSGQPSEGGTGFEALLAALVAGNANGQNELNIEKLKSGDVTPETQDIVDALAGMADALVPLANAFDKLQIPTTEQLDVARDALGKLVETINAHPNRPELAIKGPIGAFAAQLSELRQAGLDTGKKGVSDFAKVGNLMERLENILTQMGGTAPGGGQNPNGEKASLNINQMIDRLNQLADKLPTLPAQVAAQLKAQAQLEGKPKPFGNSIFEAQANPAQRQAFSTSGQSPLNANPTLSPASPEAVNGAPEKTAPLALDPNSTAARANAQPQATAEAPKPTPDGAKPDILAQLANLGQQQNADPKRANSAQVPTGFADAISAQTPELPAARMTFGQATREANLQAAAAYPELQKPALVATATAPLPTELDGVETGTERLLGQQKIETFQQQTNLIDAAKSQTAGRQVNIPGVAFEIVRQFRAGIQRFEVRLDPAELGRIDVRMEIEGNNVTARMVVERAETLDLLQRDARVLERALQQAGLNADRANLQFSLKQDGQNSSPQFENQGQDQNNSRSAGTEPNPDEQAPLSETTVYRGTAGPGGLNVWA